MTSSSGRRDSRGFTLLEILVVVAIIALLLTLGIVYALKARAFAQQEHTQSLVRQIHDALFKYQVDNRDLPAGPGNPSTWPSPDPRPGVDFDIRMLNGAGELKIPVTDLDPAAKDFVIDAWKHRIRYRKLSPERMLVWSIGPDGIDQIGAGSAERAGDDLTQVTVDVK
jgi:prepilin-type N-terminal cleavage/methylation domain-containing protein